VVAGVFGFVVSFLVVRGQDLTRLMVTLGIGLMLFEAANKASFLTGGVDGLSGMMVGKLFGAFEFDLYGNDRLLVQLRRAVHRVRGAAPGGEVRRSACPARHPRGRRRMPAIGANVNRRLKAVFTLAAHGGRLAGALLAQTTQFVGLDSLGFPRSAELLIMLVLGGTGRLYGALVGAAVFMVAQDYIAGLNPAYWQFYIGLLLVLIVLFARGGILGGLEKMASAPETEGAGMSQDITLRTEGLSKRWGPFKANTDVSADLRAGRAPRADRPERRRQDHLHQPADRRLHAQQRQGLPGRRGHHASAAAPAGASSA
jgi:branched-chain amino acid transport system permease protein